MFFLTYSWRFLRSNTLEQLEFKLKKILDVETYRYKLERYFLHTAIPYRASTGPEQGFPCVVFPRREKSVFNTGFSGDENWFFSVRNTTQGKPCFHYRDGFAVQAFLDFRNFRFTTVYNSILISSSLVLQSNLDLCIFCFQGFLLESPY